MMRPFAFLFVVLSVFSATVIGKQKAPLIQRAENGSVGYGVFEQLLDHHNPGLGTFSQQYWYNDEYWAGPGSPVRPRYRA